MRIKQRQVLPCVDRQQSAAIKVYVTEAIAENDILCFTGMHGSFMKVAKADGGEALLAAATGVAAFGASTGDVVSVFLPWKLIQNIDTSATGINVAVGAPCFASNTPGQIANAAVGSNPGIGVCLVQHATTGAVFIRP